MFVVSISSVSVVVAVIFYQYRPIVTSFGRRRLTSLNKFVVISLFLLLL